MPRKKRKPNHDMARRLEAVRSRTGLRLTKFRERLLEGGEYEVSYQATQNYHFDRPAPIDYLARVAEVFGADFTYLATGTQTDSGLTSNRPLKPGDETVIRQLTEEAVEKALQEKEEEEEGAFDEMASFLERQLQNALLQRRLANRVNQPGDDARFLLPDFYGIATDIRQRAGNPDVRLLISVLDADDPETENLERHIQAHLALCKLLDDVFANTWEGMREIVASEFGAESVERLTLEQQIRFSEAMVLALSCLFPDHGDPASFRERRTAKEEES